jgi:hypothetical protein
MQLLQKSVHTELDTDTVIVIACMPPAILLHDTFVIRYISVI